MDKPKGYVLIDAHTMNALITLLSDIHVKENIVDATVGENEVGRLVLKKPDLISFNLDSTTVIKKGELFNPIPYIRLKNVENVDLAKLLVEYKKVGGCGNE